MFSPHAIYANWLQWIKSKRMEAPTVVKLPLKPEQYYNQKYDKKYIFLHHTAGGSAASSIAHWASNKEHVATPYVIDRDGTIYECFDPEKWAYHLGVKGNSNLEKHSIGIEICSYGMLTEKIGKLVTYTGKEMDPAKAVKLDKPFRGGIYWEAYTDAQITALSRLLPYLIERFNIPVQAERGQFYEYQNPATLLPGIWSHSTVRKDKYDIFPQPSLVDLVQNLSPR